MNRRRIILLSVLVVIFISVFLYAQPSGERWREMMGPERIEKYKKMRLLEVLDLPEETSVRFISKYNLHEENIRDIRKKQIEIHNRLSESLKNQEKLVKDEKEIQKYIDDIEASRLKMVEEDKRYMKELRGILSVDQIAKYYLFQTDFDRELRDAIREMRKDMPHGRMRNE